MGQEGVKTDKISRIGLGGVKRVWSRAGFGGSEPCYMPWINFYKFSILIYKAIMTTTVPGKTDLQMIKYSFVNVRVNLWMLAYVSMKLGMCHHISFSTIRFEAIFFSALKSFCKVAVLYKCYLRVISYLFRLLKV